MHAGQRCVSAPALVALAAAESDLGVQPSHFEICHSVHARIYHIISICTFARGLLFHTARSRSGGCVATHDETKLVGAASGSFGFQNLESKFEVVKLDRTA